MRRIYTYVIYALTLTGCIVSAPSNQVVNQTSLTNYTSIQMGRCVVMPAELVETMLGFDAYLQKTDEDKLLDGEYYGNVSYYGEDTYEVKCRTKSLYCIVDTGGSSILKDGTEWEFASISFYDNYTDSNLSAYFGDIITENGILKTVNASEGEWSFNAENVESTIKKVMGESLTGWNIIGNCSEAADNGMISSSTTGDGGITYRKVLEGEETVYPYKRASYSGTFMTEICKAGVMVDWCMFTFRPGFNSTVTSSR